MNRFVSILARMSLLAVFFVSPVVHGQAPAQESSPGILDRFTDWLGNVGEITESFIAPKLGSPNGDQSSWSGLKTQARQFYQNYPIKTGAPVYVSHEFGEVQVLAWDSPQVKIAAEIDVGAETIEAAQVLAESIEVKVNSGEDVFEVRTVYPTPQGQGKPKMEVNLVVTVPRESSVMVKNHLGDTIIAGVNGGVAVESRLGAVLLQNIGGEVKAQTSGEFSFLAQNLAKGGTFDLQWSHAEFVNVAGPVNISNFKGAVTIREIALNSDMSVRNENGPIHLYVPENAKPDLAISVFAGTLLSDLPLEQNQVGLYTGGRSMNIESSQHFDLTSTYDTVQVHREGMKTASQPQAEPTGDFITFGGTPESVVLPEGASVAVEAVRGNIRVEGVDSDKIEIKATKIIRMTRKDNASTVVEALGLTHGMRGTDYLIRTDVRDDLTALGCTYYRVDLDIRLPRSVALKVVSEEGAMVVSAMQGPLTLIQTRGPISVEQCAPASEPFTVTTVEGDVTLVDCRGPLVADAKKGTLTSRNVQGMQTLNCTDGRTRVETPIGPLSIKQQGGEVRILALDITGDYNVTAEKADVSMIVPEASNVTVFAKVVNGDITSSSIKLTGTNFQNIREFTGDLNEGTYRVDLNVTDGDIAID